MPSVSGTLADTFVSADASTYVEGDASERRCLEARVWEILLIPLRLVACVAFALGCFASSIELVRAAPCAVTNGGRVVLESDAVDPDVFIWDSRARLVDYAAGQWGNTRAIFAHTLLTEPGTPAAVVACVAGVAHPKFGTGDEDAVGVKVVAGRYRGRYGWVLSSDTHLRAVAPSPPAAFARATRKEVKR